MKRYKLKKWHIVCSVILSVMICFSGFIGMVITGVVAQGNIDGTLKYNIGNNNTQNANVNNNTVNNDAAYYDDNGTVVYDDNNSSADYSGDTNNGNAVSNGNTNNSTVGSQSHQPSNNNAGGNSGSTNTNTQTAVVNKNNLPTNPTKADIVNIYATLMNKAKADKPGFTKVEYQELPGDPANRVVSQGEEHVTAEYIEKLFGFIEDLGVFVPKEKAEAEPYIHEKGDDDMSKFPVFSREKGSYLTDPKAIDKYTYTKLSNGNIKMTFVLVPENNPEPIGENTNVAPSYTGAVFSPMSKEQIDGTVYHPIVTIFAKDIQYSLRYHDCSVVVEFNPNTMQIVNLEQVARVSIKGQGDVVGVGVIGVERQELIGTVIIKDLKY
ncbi:MAG: hypothetical protein J6D06_00580 [Clostridia bacterium]|nr:hypothetical protein [Clostridia bacterium]